MSVHACVHLAQLCLNPCRCLHYALVFVKLLIKFSISKYIMCVIFVQRFKQWGKHFTNFHYYYHQTQLKTNLSYSYPYSAILCFLLFCFCRCCWAILCSRVFHQVRDLQKEEQHGVASAYQWLWWQLAWWRRWHCWRQWWTWCNSLASCRCAQRVNPM